MRKIYSVPCGFQWKNFTSLREAKRMARGNGSNKVCVWQNDKKIACYLFDWYITNGGYRRKWRKF